MKCVCPSGGDRTCPDDCLLAVWHGLPANDRKARRKPIAQQLARQGYTQEEIAKQLGVSQRQISTDLRDFDLEATSNSSSRRERPSTPGHGGARAGAGRRRGSGSSQRSARTRRNPLEQATPRRRQTDNQETQIIARVAAGESTNQVAADLGIDGRSVRRVVEDERRRRTEPTINPSDLSLTAQQKLAAAIRQHKRQLDIDFSRAVQAETTRRINEISLPHLKRKEAEFNKGINSHNGYIPKVKFNLIRSALHPDSRQSISEGRLREAFEAFSGLERILVKKAERTSETATLPDTIAEWDADRRRAAPRRGAPNTPTRR